MEYHINAKEPLVAKFSLNTFVKVSDAHVKLLSDNITTVHGIYCTICTLINLSYIIHLKTSRVLIPAFKKRGTMMQMQSHVKKELNWNEYLTKNFYKNYF